MENKHQHILPHEFEAYLLGKMSADEKAAFELRVENDPFAKEALEGFISLENNAKATGLIKEQINIIENKTGYKKENKALKIPLFKILSIAASIIVVIGGLFFSWNFLQDKNGGMSEAKTSEKSEEFDFKTRTRKENFFDEKTEDVYESEEETSEVVSIAENAMAISKEEKKETKPVSETSSSKEVAQKTLSESPSISSQNDFYDIAEVSKPESLGAARANSPSAVSEESVSDFSLTQTNFEKGYSFFEKGNFNESIKYFSESIKENRKVIESYYYSGLSYYYQNKYNNAIKAFDIVISDNYHVLANNAKWYKADIYIKQGRKEDARVILQELIDSNSYFKKQAEEAIKKL